MYALGAPQLAMSTRRPGSATSARQSLDRHEQRLLPRHALGTAFTFITPLGFARVPMTREHAGLLGPCFKTGPESTQS